MDNLDKKGWLDFALKQLAANGFSALKAQPLARKLGVTRGSFYHHFASIDAFNQALIQHWTNSTTMPLIAEVEKSGDPQMQLENLLKQALRSGEALERAVRAWATVNSQVADMVEDVDKQRIDFAEKLLLAAGVPPSETPSRARLLYWAAIGRLMMPHPQTQQLSDVEITSLTYLITRPAS